MAKQQKFIKISYFFLKGIFWRRNNIERKHLFRRNKYQEVLQLKKVIGTFLSGVF